MPLSPFNILGIKMKLADKLSKCGESLTVYMYDNGFMVEVSGRSHDDDWTGAKVVCDNLEEVTALIKEATEMERD